MFSNGLYDQSSSFTASQVCPQILPLQSKPASQIPTRTRSFPLGLHGGIQHRAQAGVLNLRPDRGYCSKFLPWLNLPLQPLLAFLPLLMPRECSGWIEHDGLKEQRGAVVPPCFGGILGSKNGVCKDRCTLAWGPRWRWEIIPQLF